MLFGCHHYYYQRLVLSYRDLSYPWIHYSKTRHCEFILVILQIGISFDSGLVELTMPYVSQAYLSSSLASKSVLLIPLQKKNISKSTYGKRVAAYLGFPTLQFHRNKEDRHCFRSNSFTYTQYYFLFVSYMASLI